MSKVSRQLFRQIIVIVIHPTPNSLHSNVPEKLSVYFGLAFKEITFYLDSIVSPKIF